MPNEVSLNMCKRFIIYILLSIVQFPETIYATSWDTFREVKDQYYQLDKQDFNEITCLVEVPLMSNLIEQIKNQLVPLQGKIECQANLSLFTLTYNHNVGLIFTRPVFELELKTNEGVRDVAKAKSGLDMARQGFRQHVDGTMVTLEGIFDAYIIPKEKEFKNIKATSITDKEISVTYTKDGVDVHEIYSGNTINGKYKNILGETTYKLTYDTNANDKFMLRNATTIISQPIIKMKASSSISYQKLDELYFPKQVKTYFEEEIQSLRQQGEIIINLTNCTKN